MRSGVISVRLTFPRLDHILSQRMGATCFYKIPSHVPMASINRVVGFEMSDALLDSPLARPNFLHPRSRAAPPLVGTQVPHIQLPGGFGVYQIRR